MTKVEPEVSSPNMLSCSTLGDKMQYIANTKDKTTARFFEEDQEEEPPVSPTRIISIRWLAKCYERSHVLWTEELYDIYLLWGAKPKADWVAHGRALGLTNTSTYRLFLLSSVVVRIGPKKCEGSSLQRNCLAVQYGSLQRFICFVLRWFTLGSVIIVNVNTFILLMRGAMKQNPPRLKRAIRLLKRRSGHFLITCHIRPAAFASVILHNPGDQRSMHPLLWVCDREKKCGMWANELPQRSAVEGAVPTRPHPDAAKVHYWPGVGSAFEMRRAPENLGKAMEVSEKGLQYLISIPLVSHVEFRSPRDMKPACSIRSAAMEIIHYRAVWEIAIEYRNIRKVNDQNKGIILNKHISRFLRTDYRAGVRSERSNHGVRGLHAVHGGWRLNTELFGDGKWKTVKSGFLRMKISPRRMEFAFQVLLLRGKEFIAKIPKNLEREKRPEHPIGSNVSITIHTSCIRRRKPGITEISRRYNTLRKPLSQNYLDNGVSAFGLAESRYSQARVTCIRGKCNTEKRISDDFDRRTCQLGTLAMRYARGFVRVAELNSKRRIQSCEPRSHKFCKSRRMEVDK
ncbi:uncharacterized protein BDR25DRAFT_391015 [Lindgomyces ingoldianus]|uniref:Uncharacterized protein n=1 Tax=Lindgomyces ingoldianus TaxID=673940 RepID=A0ACB6RB95_9PLEO|nr:uncharacterized protein BDR25DRAFT_391015 [Lindgomyces ingoldianus]KAF2476514.1 hypothetical protein BDR25DRAFT_391015 [Lindgomyces ingoldianus]